MAERRVIETATLLMLLALLAVPIAWALPPALALDGVALWTTVSLAALAPASTAWLVGAAVLTPAALDAGDRTGQRDIAAAITASVLISAFVAARLTPGIAWIGGAFFTLRHLHVVGDWWMGRLAAPRLRAHLRYQLFLPVMFTGPIHRIQTFERQALRRRWGAQEFFDGLERSLLGALSAFVVGGWLVRRAGGLLMRGTSDFPAFAREWMYSAIDWVALYFVFAGLTSVALGIALMIGLRLEENFNRPWEARNLLDFWLRWHMSLTSWCRDYVFRPVMALTRSALAGLIAAMLAIGLWHEFSLYYVLWSIWQVLGIVITRATLRHVPVGSCPKWLRASGGPLIVLAWLSAARPVCSRLLELL